MWIKQSVFYQIYPLGLCGAPWKQDHKISPRIEKIIQWIPHMKALGVDALYFNPVFFSSTHGYDTIDYGKIDPRLGTNETFQKVCRALHDSEIRVVLDGVFHHVGREFWAFVDVLQKREASAYADWFFIDFNGESCYGDHLWYEGWEGHFELVKLNLKNPAVKNYLIQQVKSWIDQFDIDGLRLDVAYSLDQSFLCELSEICRAQKEDFCLIGELLHGDYNQFVNETMLSSCTNYECYKGLYSSCNSMNLFEISYSLNRQFGKEPWTLYKGKHLLSFLDNHDVSRIATILHNPVHIKPLYALLFAMPGVPCVYYGSEWGIQGDKADGDEALRPMVEKPVENELFYYISKCAAMHRQYQSLWDGDFENILVTNRQYVFQRSFSSERIFVAVNIDDQPFQAHFHTGSCYALDLLSGQQQDISEGACLEPYRAYYWLAK